MAISTDSVAGKATQHGSAQTAATPMRTLSIHGWTAGFGNMFSKELGDWFSGRRLLVQAVTWTAIINGTIALLMFVLPLVERWGRDLARSQGDTSPAAQAIDPLAIGLSTFFSLAAIAGSIGVIILSQDDIVGEKQLGTAAWIMSKPVSRTAFILSKLAANATGILVYALALPALITYVEVSLAAGRLIDMVPFLLALPLVVVTLLFYLCLSIMLGVLFSQRAPLLAVLFGVLFGGIALAGVVPGLASVLPVNLADSGGSIAAGAPMPLALVWTMLATIAWCGIFIAVAVRRFQGQEL